MILILLVFMGIGFFVQYKLKAKFEAYSKIPTASGMSGREVAEKMLSDFGITSVVVQSVPGKLTDHYNPADKTVNLSPEVYNGRSISAAAVAAHECGHAVQHATAYKWLGFRTMMVPVVSISGKIMNFMFIAMLLGAFALQLFPLSVVLMTLIVAQAAITAFTLVTLPVEYDASNRALAWLRTTSVTSQEEHAKAEDALKWAARTYLVAALAAVTQLLYYVMLLMGSRD
jgi:Zn-dependent membrane protease YugP